MTDILNKIGTGKARFHLGSASGFNEAEVRLYGMQENYLQIVNSDYYMPNEIQKGLDLPYIQKTSLRDAVYALYSNQSLDPNDNEWNPYNVTTYDYFGDTKPIPEIKLLIPEGYRDILSLDTTTQARLSYNQQSSQVFRGRIRAMITKIPGPFLYMSYRQIFFLKGQLMTSTL